MSYVRPTLAEHIIRAQTILQQRFPGDGVFRSRSILRAFAYLFGLGMHGAYGFIGWLARQLSDETSDDDTMESEAAQYGMSYLPPNKAQGNITVTGLLGSVVAAGKQWQSDASVLYEVVADVTLTGTSAPVAVIAMDAGAAGNLDAGATLTVVSPIAGLDNSAIVAAGGIANGTDKEKPAELRVRLRARKQKTPAGGKSSDYEAWVREANADVDQVWVGTELGEGTVSVRFTMRADSGSRFPAPAVVTAVAAYLDEKKPVEAHVYTLGPIRVVQDFSIHLVPDTAETRANVTDALDALITAEGTPGGTLLLTHIQTAISTADKVVDYTTTLTTNLSYGVGELPDLGVITWL